jgi:hypothetical protein
LKRPTSIPDEVFRPALLLCIDRYTVVGVAAMLRISSNEVQAWRSRRRNAKLQARAAVMMLESMSPAAVEDLHEYLMAQIDVDQPLKAPKVSQTLSQ